MNRISTFQLRKLIPKEEFDYLLLKGILNGYSGVRQKINELLKTGVIIRVKKGLYVFGPEYNNVPVCKETLANLIYGPSCVSLEYALSYHGIIPERVETVTNITFRKNKIFHTPLGAFTYQSIPLRAYPHGIEQIWIDSQHPVWMASPAKALCDYLLIHKVPVFSDAHSARAFVEDDLRIDLGQIEKSVMAQAMAQLNVHYRSATVTCIQEAL